MDGLLVTLLRQEVALASDVPPFPAWPFQGNAISGVAYPSLLIARWSGTPLVASSFSSGPIEQATAATLGLPIQAVSAFRPTGTLIWPRCSSRR